MPCCRWIFTGYYLGLICLLAANHARGQQDFEPLFPTDGIPTGWTVRAWDDLGKKAEGNTAWTVKDGVLQPGQERGTWLMSEQKYSDFILEFEIKLTEVGNSGVALRAPLKDDPAFVALEFQIADQRYNPAANEAEITGALYRAQAPAKQVYQPTKWNRVRIELRGKKLTATLNDEQIHDLDLGKMDQPTKRHDGSDAPSIKDRPLSGHIGFQHLSRNNEPVLIRHARIKVLAAEE
ncbi:MAG: DUF1080 domain-containing protein [Pirellulales bacterium]|nr:DUF1080 domain-containing protein [Pirellulales bacterium]